MREIIFKMERPGKLVVGQSVIVNEGTLPSNYYYTIGVPEDPSLAMSPNIPFTKRLLSREGVVAAIEDTPRGSYVKAQFDEDEPED
ncbi:MAG: hypothetical protein K6E92_04715 [Lachnospiraceae bacterium]|nr:hypothetical protein [Lachnospiraceae bacterium]